MPIKANLQILPPQQHSTVSSCDSRNCHHLYFRTQSLLYMQDVILLPLHMTVQYITISLFTFSIIPHAS